MGLQTIFSEIQNVGSTIWGSETIFSSYSALFYPTALLTLMSILVYFFFAKFGSNRVMKAEGEFLGFSPRNWMFTFCGLNIVKWLYLAAFGVLGLLNGEGFPSMIVLGFLGLNFATDAYLTYSMFSGSSDKSTLFDILYRGAYIGAIYSVIHLIRGYLTGAVGFSFGTLIPIGFCLSAFVVASLVGSYVFNFVRSMYADPRDEVNGKPMNYGYETPRASRIHLSNGNAVGGIAGSTGEDFDSFQGSACNK